MHPGLRTEEPTESLKPQPESLSVGCILAVTVVFYSSFPCLHSPRAPFLVHSHCCPIRWIPRDSKVNPAEEG